jgi:hypothetical protein
VILVLLSKELDQLCGQQEDKGRQVCYLTAAKQVLSDHDFLYFFLLDDLS